MDKFFVLSGSGGRVKMSITLTRVEIGKIGIINLLNSEPSLTCPLELLLTDSGGENVYEVIQELPFRFCLPDEFNIDGKILVDVFSFGKAIVSGVIQEGNFNANLKATNVDEEFYYNKDYNYLYNNSNITEEEKEEARYYAKKAQKLYSNHCLGEAPQQTFFDEIKNDFNLLYGVGTDDYLLTKKFGGSRWRKLELDGDVYLLGKFYTANDEQTPSKVAIAVPSVSGATKTRSLGEKAEFYPATIYDEFGFWVLIQSAVSGKAEKI